MKEGSVLVGCLFLILIVFTIFCVVVFVGYNWPEWQGWTE